jgi:hypothetical protein
MADRAPSFGVLLRRLKLPPRPCGVRNVAHAAAVSAPTPGDPKSRALVSWIDGHEEARAREKLRQQGRNEILRALMLGKLKVRNVVTGDWFHISSPWTDADVERWDVTRETLAQTVAPADGLPPADDSLLADLARLDAIRSL